jgi:F-type H+-transporting ATPase subunit b
MPIDWFTVAAQVLNFLVLAWLLKRFLYGPILQAVDAREKRVAAELADAATQQAQAQQERDTFAHKIAEFDQQRASRLAQVNTEAAQQRQQLLDQARAEADAWAEQREASLQAEARQLDQILRARAQQEVFAMARKTLHDLASTTLEEHVCAVFVRRLRETDEALRASLARSLDGGGDAVLVRSAFALTEPMRQTIEQALHELIPMRAPVQFVRSPELVCGIELVGGGHKLGWNVLDYLQVMEQRVGELVQPKAEAARKSPSAASAVASA